MLYFNNSATSFPKPQVVTDAIIDFLHHAPCHSSRSGIEHDMEDIDYSCRCSIAKLFNVSLPERIVFTSGSTEALNLAIKGLQLKNCHVISTCIEHNSVIRPLKTLEKKADIETTFVKCDSFGYVEPEDIQAAIKNTTKLIIVNHCSNVTGTVLDIKKISEIAHKNNCIFAVDASQSAGLIPIDVQDQSIDLLAFTGHKSLYGLQGIGGLYIREGIDLEPLKIGGTGILSEYLYQPKGMPIHYEAGTQNMLGIVSLNAGVNFILETGINKIREHKARLVKRIIEQLKNSNSIKIYNHDLYSCFSNFCFNIEGIVPEEVNYILESSYDIHVRSGIHCAPLLLEQLRVHPWGTVRCSPSFFTKDDEIDIFINAVKEIANTFPRSKHK